MEFKVTGGVPGGRLRIEGRNTKGIPITHVVSREDVKKYFGDKDLLDKIQEERSKFKTGDEVYFKEDYGYDGAIKKGSKCKIDFIFGTKYDPDLDKKNRSSSSHSGGNIHLISYERGHRSTVSLFPEDADKYLAKIDQV